MCCSAVVGTVAVQWPAWKPEIEKANGLLEEKDWSCGRDRDAPTVDLGELGMKRGRRCSFFVTSLGGR